ncbi:MAG: hypothetical protein M3P30_01185 [Chloroflexota bacterium]|nr:hypothetical protein [Chloroflexota bacterium]
MALWLLAPWGGGWGPGSNPGGDANAALPPSLLVDGEVQVETHDDVVTRLMVPLAVRGEDSVVLTDESGSMRAETSMSETASAAVPATYSVTWLDGNGDRSLDPGEHAVLTVDLPARSSVHPGNPLRLVLHPSGGGSLIIDDVLP